MSHFLTVSAGVHLVGNNPNLHKFAMGAKPLHNGFPRRAWLSQDKL